MLYFYDYLKMNFEFSPKIFVFISFRLMNIEYSITFLNRIAPFFFFYFLILSFCFLRVCDSLLWFVMCMCLCVSVYACVYLLHIISYKTYLRTTFLRYLQLTYNTFTIHTSYNENLHTAYLQSTQITIHTIFTGTVFRQI